MVIVATASSHARNSGRRNGASSRISAARSADSCIKSAIDRSMRCRGVEKHDGHRAFNMGCKYIQFGVSAQDSGDIHNTISDLIGAPASTTTCGANEFRREGGRLLAASWRHEKLAHWMTLSCRMQTATQGSRTNLNLARP